ncbi:MAG: hypothetical protein ACRELF_24880, partial [Gemmataceae bacterium]
MGCFSRLGRVPLRVAWPFSAAALSSVWRPFALLGSLSADAEPLTSGCPFSPTRSQPLAVGSLVEEAGFASRLSDVVS